jgi:3-oxoacyl-[acyl-carrier protein] reductase
MAFIVRLVSELLVNSRRKKSRLMSNIASRAIIVTGGSRGLGLGLISDLVANGYRVATCSRSSTPELEHLLANGRVFWKKGAVGESRDDDAFFAAAEAWAGPDGIWGLVNNAGITGEGILANFPNVDSEHIIQTNLVGALYMARLAARHMLSRTTGGRIINISSIISLRGHTGLAAYSASKAGLDGMTRALAREIGRRQITVNSINPGYLDTDISPMLQDAQKRQIVNRTPLGRLGRIEDVSPVVRFLLSDDARFITGQCLVVDGGVTC